MFEQHYSINIRPFGLTNAAATAYVSGVRDNLRRMLGTTSGRILLNSIHYNAVKLRAQVTLKPQKQTCDAKVDFEDAVWVNDRIAEWVVRFSPDDFSDSGECGKRALERGLNGARLPNEVLFHELVHVMRYLSRHGFGPRLSGGFYKYDNFEEFCAVLATNIYISDGTNHVKSSLRRDHRTGKVLEPELSGSFTFFQSGGNAFHWVQCFCDQNMGFTKALAGVKADFNPIAAYYEDSAKALEMSLTPLARKRDSIGSRQEADDYERDLLSNDNRQPQVP